MYKQKYLDAKREYSMLVLQQQGGAVSFDTTSRIKTYIGEKNSIMSSLMRGIHQEMSRSNAFFTDDTNAIVTSYEELLKKLENGNYSKIYETLTYQDPNPGYFSSKSTNYAVAEDSYNKVFSNIPVFSVMEGSSIYEIVSDTLSEKAKNYWNFGKAVFNAITGKVDESKSNPTIFRYKEMTPNPEIPLEVKNLFHQYYGNEVTLVAITIESKSKYNMLSTLRKYNNIYKQFYEFKITQNKPL